ncbi:MAG: Gfo/Idh/MocA family oxidoreductase [Clostridia bacterium]|nr:Gfo/Idh/MocA family oxidoreductase [Clostridia bacterium]
MVRIGIVGLGNMGRSHSKNIFGGKIPNGKLTATCDTDASKLEWLKEMGHEEVKTFTDAETMFKSGEVDLVIVAVPHYFHPPMVKLALANNLNVISEKPAGVYTKQVREMNEAAEKSDKIFGVMFNQRTNPVYRKVRQMIQDGELGHIKRVTWIITDWYRTQVYHDSGAWRSTWKDEGGGLLVNQCPHQIDLWQWLFGMPKRVRAFAGFGKYRNIEVETEVTAYMEYENGTVGTFISSTTESPGTNRLEIACDRGTLIIQNGEITFKRMAVPEPEFNEHATLGFQMPDVWECKVPPLRGAENSQHAGIVNNVIDAIEKGTPLLAQGTEGINGVKLANSIHLSAWTDSWVDVDNLDEDLYYNMLQEKIKNSTYVKNLREQVSDTKGTY